MNVIVNVLIVLILFIVGNEELRSIMGYLYFLQYISFIVVIFSKYKKNINFLYFLSPSFITITYICLTFGLASLYLDAGYGNLYKFVTIYRSSNNFRLANIFFIVCNFIVFIIYLKNLKKTIPWISLKPNRNRIVSNSGLFIAIVFFVIFSLFELDAAFFGGNGSISFVPKFISAIVVCLYASRLRGRLRYFIYFLFLILFVIASYDSKREIVFLLLSIIVIDFYNNPIKLKLDFKIVLIITIVSSFFMGIILVSSVMRGYGSYNVDNIGEAIEKVPDYISSDLFLDVIGENMELNYSYGNALNSVDLFLDGKQEVLYGETFLKVLFTPMPKALINYRPSSMISIYSPMINYGNGELQPVVVYSEFLWNFSVLFFIPLYFIFSLLEKLYAKIFVLFKTISVLNFKLIFYLFTYSIFMQFIRGSGLDLLVVYQIFSVPFIVFIVFINKIKNINEKSFNY